MVLAHSGGRGATQLQNEMSLKRSHLVFGGARLRRASSEAVARFDRQRVQHQIDLLLSVHWCYLAPFALCLLLAFVDLRKWEQGITHTLLFFSFGIALFLGVWMLNRSAVRADLEPRLRKLEETLRELESENS